ncbi:MAG TPA: SUMF1/EgtB/PvdO family nonheme iron enzyme, partial [Fibrobacteria bacterium]|nr:SUMF1/EgtB/PvdO family nonheme iron enzyme [Fibrobacteria bacterium]
EAEWEFSARAGSAAEYPWGGPDSSKAADHAWFAGNAGNRVHPVKGLKANAFGVHDMAGNVMEWVGDWKGPYPTQGTQDFSGTRDPGPEFDSPIKGGAFKFGLHELRPAARTGVYASSRSSRSEYVGFRCALGAIKSPRFATPEGGLSGTDGVRLDLQRLGNLVEGRSAKLVFVNVSSTRRQLAYVDYREFPARVREFEDVGDVYHPSISPDGAWVAFGSSAEGVEAGSRIRVRSLERPEEASVDFGEGFIPRWWVAESDTFLIYSTTGEDNWRPQWTASRTLMRKVSGGAPVGPPVPLSPEGGFHDGRSRDGRWLATGFRLLKVHDMAAGTTRTLFTAPDNGKVGEDTSQVCNVSMAPDSTGRVLFLDFGYDAVSRITGSWYDIHQVAFLADPLGKVIRWFHAPPREKGWDDLEWSNHADFAVSGSTDREGGNRHLYLINLRDSTYAQLATGTRLAMPALWLGRPADSIPTQGLSLDSLGYYDAPTTDAYQSAFANKMAL